MKFFKNIFSKKKEGNAPTSSEETFACGSCGQTRPVSQKKQHAHVEEGGNKNVCEFC